MPDLKTGKDCCGCTACESICGKHAITMVPDSLGFKYPKVDLDKCVECGMCEKVCSFNPDYKTPDNFEQPIPYGVRLKDINEVMKSRSGGAFVAFSDWILEKGGVVYGVGYKDHFVVAHKRATTPEERDEFRGSKYVQSDLEGIFPMVKQDLKDGKWVMFSGTGCQVAGLKAYLPKPLQEKLVTVDIVCHGVPSQKMWQDYLSYIEKKESGDVIGVNFRNKKDFGWNTHRETFTIKDSRSGKLKVNTYDYTFYHHMMQRPSCGICHFCNLRRNGDLTLADFWGWEKTADTMNHDNKGLSLILCSTPKGKRVFEEVYGQINFFEPKLEDCIQNHLKAPTKAKSTDSQFQKDYELRGFEYIRKKYGNVGWRYQIKKILGGLKRRAFKIIGK
jgi:coenzyme F420-reducing hydrogenase beta subunit